MSSDDARARSAFGGVPEVGHRDILRLAWPSVLSFVLNNAYRINDQYWVEGLGSEAQAALGSTIFVLIMNFSVFFLAVGGALPLVARATGAGDAEARDSWIRHALFLGSVIAIAMSVIGSLMTDTIISWVGLEGESAAYASDYLGTLYLFSLPMALAPLLDSCFVGMGHTRIPLLMQGTAVTFNFVLNPILIYGSSRYAWVPFEGLEMQGAALATAASRAIATTVGLTILIRTFGVNPLRNARIRPQKLAEFVRISLPNSLSISAYAGVYWLIMSIVISELGDEVFAALGIGFNVFEGVSFPFYLGVAIAGSSLIGRSLGAGSPEQAKLAVSRVRHVGTVCGLGFTTAFLVGGPLLIPVFTEDLDVTRHTLSYVNTIALSQFFVAHECVNEKVLWGAGHTRPILWISVPGNLLRIPLAWFLALELGWGALGVWWAINLTTVFKSAAFFLTVRGSRWATRAFAA